MDNSIKQFNKRLNESVSRGRWEQWRNYRDELMKFISKGMGNNGSCIILGAGNMNDIDLNALPANEITLADIDPESIKNGLTFQNYKVDDVIRMDIGGLDSADIFNKIISKPTEMKRILESHELVTSITTAKYKNIMISAVYTQLFIPQFLMLMHKNDNLADKSLENGLAFAARLISHLNDTVISLAAEDSTVCAWSDIFEYSMDDPALNDIKKHKDDSKWMESFYQSYIRDYGHGLGSFGVEDLASRLDGVTQKWLLWPFDDRRTMIVKAIIGVIVK